MKLSCSLADMIQLFKSLFVFLDQSGGVESTAVSTLHKSIEKKYAKNTFNNFPIFDTFILGVLF